MNERSLKLRRWVLLAMLAAVSYLIVSYIRIPVVLFLKSLFFTSSTPISYIISYFQFLCKAQNHKKAPPSKESGADMGQIFPCSTKSKMMQVMSSTAASR